ncbi:unnamed protein product [Colias eurytheme]|nr:unnamed protein product [Colias eurytheme]
MNPLKRSDVYKKFSNQILLPRSEGTTGDLNFNSIESSKEIQNRTKKSNEIAIRTTNANQHLNNLNHPPDLANTIDKRDSVHHIEIRKEKDAPIPEDNEKQMPATRLFPVHSIRKFKEHFHSFDNGDRMIDLQDNEIDGAQDADTVVMK